MLTYVFSILVVAALLAGWVAVQAAYRRFARRHPERGPWRGEDAGGCGACAAAESCTPEDAKPATGRTGAACGKASAR